MLELIISMILGRFNSLSFMVFTVMLVLTCDSENTYLRNMTPSTIATVPRLAPTGVTWYSFGLRNSSICALGVSEFERKQNSYAAFCVFLPRFPMVTPKYI